MAANVTTRLRRTSIKMADITAGKNLILFRFLGFLKAFLGLLGFIVGLRTVARARGTVDTRIRSRRKL